MQWELGIITNVTTLDMTPPPNVTLQTNGRRI